MNLTSEEIVRLTPSERLKIIEQLWISLDHATIPVTPAQQAELTRRLATFEEDCSQGMTWENLKAALAQRHS